MGDESDEATNNDYGGAQLGDLTQRDAAQTIYNITASLGEATKLLQNDIDRLHLRVDAIERIEQQHANERAAMTRLVTMLGTESRTVGDVHQLLRQQINSEGIERLARQRWLNRVLSALITLAVINVLLNIYRVLRGSRAAQA
jgi:hypothetical protein